LAILLDPRFRGGDKRNGSWRAFRVAGPTAFAEAGITHKDVYHLMIYDAFAHRPIYGPEDLGFVPRGEAGAFVAERDTAPGGKDQPLEKMIYLSECSSRTEFRAAIAGKLPHPS